MSQTQAGSKILKPALIISGAIFIVLLKFGFIFLLIALLPAIMAYFIDYSPRKSAFRIVLLCNLAGALPHLMPMMHTAIEMKQIDVMPIMLNPVVWLMIYGGAAVGWCLIALCRFIARFLVVMYFEYQVASLERFQKKLLAEWGERVAEKP